MRAARAWSVRHAGALWRCYRAFEATFVALNPLWRRLGFARIERPVAAIERGVKGVLFDCRMCGACVLSHTGMSCPMNCPKELRNGPCGGVRPDGRCEIKPEMTCVWVAAWEGSRRMAGGDAIAEVQPPLDHTFQGRSSWLAIARERGGAGAQR